MDKICVNGKVAVAISRDGVGWSTCDDVSPLDPEFNELFINHNYEKAYILAEEKGLYAAGVYNITIIWIDEGTKFSIIEFEGAEAIQLFNEEKWYTA